FGAYTLLDLQWLSAEDDHGRLGDGSVNRIARLPDALTPQLWRLLAARYREEPAVLFDLYNEPHDVSADVWRMLAGSLLGVIREQNPAAVIFVSGVDWGYDLRDVTLHETGVVYSTHVYPWKSLKWRKAFGWLADDRPVFAGEWGGKDEHLVWGGELCEYLRELGMGWTAWSWSDYPRLVLRNEPDNWTATEFGNLVRRQLRIPMVLP
ncbi:MAG: cellulase family glycosylhydrolase, partial [Bryobacteraceae bacterium]|nr:cellulase family glycosylhydrolase [Bryobacteraceae bacterium]